LYLCDEIGVVVDEEVEEGCDDDVVGGAGVAVAVDAEVEVDGDHGVVYEGAEWGGRYKANMNMWTKMNSNMESMVRSTKNLTRFYIFDF
jgi:hypothetical protein